MFNISRIIISFVLINTLFGICHNFCLAKDTFNINTIKTENRNIQINSKAREFFNSGVKYLNNKDYINAVELFKSAIKEDPNYTKAYNNLGVAYRNLGLPEKAIEQYHKSLKIDPDNYTAYQLMGVAYLMLGKNKESEKTFKKLKYLNPNEPEAYFGLGDVYSVEKKFFLANECFEKALKLYTDEQGKLKADAYLNIGLNYFRQKEYDQAIKYLKYSTDYYTENKTAYYYLGLCYLFNKPENLIAAENNIKKAIDLGYKVPKEIFKHLGFKETASSSG